MLDEIARERARRMLMTALKAECDDHVEGLLASARVPQGKLKSANVTEEGGCQSPV